MRLSFVLTVAAGLGRAAASLSRDDDLVARTVAAVGLDDTAALSNIESRDLLEDIWEAITNAASCAGCQSVLGLLKGLAVLGDGAFSRTIIEICKLAGVEDDDVCEGAIGLQAPVIRRAIQDMRLNSKSSRLFCITFLGLCPYPDVELFEPEFPSPELGNGTVEPSGREPIKVVHFADIHIDPLYTEGANTECSKPICCRPYTPEEEPGQTDNPAGPFGDQNCNTPIALEESMYAAINELVPDLAFSIFTGDMIDSAVWNTSRPYNEDIIESSYNRMAESFDLLYAAIGNHEMHPTNLIAPSHISDSASWMYEAIASSVSRWVGDDAASTIRSFGGYSVRHPSANLRIITLNTNFYYTNNYYMFEEVIHPDPEGQMEWLVEELDAAESSGENVWILGHQAFGDTNAFRDPTSSLDRIVNRYSDIIRGMFFGHTHSDHFQITYSDYDNRTADNARVVSYLNPSLTPATGRNPAFRVYDVDPETFAVLDATVYYADMASPSFNSPTGPEWQKYYSAREAYGPLVSSPPSEGGELSAAFWHEVTIGFEADDDAFAAYMRRKSRGFRDGEDDCTGECKDLEICQLRAARAEDNCYEPEPGIDFKKVRRSEAKRKWESADQREQDGEEVARAALAAVGKKKEALELLGKRAGEGRRRK